MPAITRDFIKDIENLIKDKKIPPVIKITGIFRDDKNDQENQSLIADFNRVLEKSKVPTLYFKTIGPDLISQIKPPSSLTKIIIKSLYKEQKAIQQLLLTLKQYPKIAKKVNLECVTDETLQNFRAIHPMSQPSLFSVSGNEYLSTTAPQNSVDTSLQQTNPSPYAAAGFSSIPSAPFNGLQFFPQPASGKKLNTDSAKTQSSMPPKQFSQKRPSSEYSAQPNKVQCLNPPPTFFGVPPFTFSAPLPRPSAPTPPANFLINIKNNRYLIRLITLLKKGTTYLMIKDAKIDSDYPEAMNRLIVNFNAALQSAQASLQTIELSGDLDLGIAKAIIIPDYVKSIIIKNIKKPEVIKELNMKIKHVTHLSLIKTAAKVLAELELPAGPFQLELDLSKKAIQVINQKLSSRNTQLIEDSNNTNSNLTFGHN